MIGSFDTETERAQEYQSVFSLADFSEKPESLIQLSHGRAMQPENAPSCLFFSQKLHKLSCSIFSAVVESAGLRMKKRKQHVDRIQQQEKGIVKTKREIEHSKENFPREQASLASEKRMVRYGLF